MNDLEKDLLNTILNNEPLLNAVRKVFIKRVEQEKPVIGDADNMKLGEKYRAYEQAGEMIKKGFDDLLAYKVEKKPDKGFDKSR